MRGRDAVPQDVLVIGSGIAGLSAAYDLQRAGYRVTILEKGDIPGGRFAERPAGSLRLHTGASVIFSFYHDMFDLVRETGIADRVRPMPWGEASIINNGDREYFLDAAKPARQLLRCPALSWRSRLRLPLLLPEIRRARKRTDPNLAHTAAYLDDESMAAWAKRRVGEDFLENIIQPFWAANWGQDPEVVSKACFLPLFAAAGGRAAVYTFRGGIGLLTRTLAGLLDVRLDSAVEAVRRRPGGGWTARFTGPGGPGELDADLVVCAVEGTRVAALFDDLDDDARGFFEGVRYTKCGIMHYVLDAPPEPKARFYTRRAPIMIDNYYAATASERAEGYPHRIYAGIGARGTREFLARYSSYSPGALDEFARTEIRKLQPDLDEHVTEAHEQWFEDMLPEYYPGYIRGMAAFLERQEDGRRDLYFAGDYLSQAHTGGACASGRRTARTVLRHWG